MWHFLPSGCSGGVSATGSGHIGKQPVFRRERAIVRCCHLRPKHFVYLRLIIQFRVLLLPCSRVSRIATVRGSNYNRRTVCLMCRFSLALLDVTKTCICTSSCDTPGGGGASAQHVSAVCPSTGRRSTSCVSVVHWKPITYKMFASCHYCLALLAAALACFLSTACCGMSDTRAALKQLFYRCVPCVGYTRRGFTRLWHNRQLAVGKRGGRHGWFGWRAGTDVRFKRAFRSSCIWSARVPSTLPWPGQL